MCSLFCSYSAQGLNGINGKDGKDGVDGTPGRVVRRSCDGHVTTHPSVT